MSPISDAHIGLALYMVSVQHAVCSVMCAACSFHLEVCSGGVYLAAYSFHCRWVLELWLLEPTATAGSASAPGR